MFISCYNTNIVSIQFYYEANNDNVNVSSLLILLSLLAVLIFLIVLMTSRISNGGIDMSDPKDMSKVIIINMSEDQKTLNSSCEKFFNNLNKLIIYDDFKNVVHNDINENYCCLFELNGVLNLRYMSSMHDFNMLKDCVKKMTFDNVDIKNIHIITIEDYIFYNYLNFSINNDELYLYKCLCGIKLYKITNNNFLLSDHNKIDDKINKILSITNDKLTIFALSRFFFDDKDAISISTSDMLLHSKYLDASCIYVYEGLFNNVDCIAELKTNASRDFMYHLVLLNNMKVSDVISYSKLIDFYLKFINKYFDDHFVKYIGRKNFLNVIHVLCELLINTLSKECLIQSDIFEECLSQFLLINCMHYFVELPYHNISKDQKNDVNYYIPSAFEKCTILNMKYKNLLLKDEYFEKSLLFNRKFKFNILDTNKDKRKYFNVESLLFVESVGWLGNQVGLSIENDNLISLMGYKRKFFVNTRNLYKSGNYGVKMANFIYKYTLVKCDVLNIVLMYNNSKLILFILEKIKGNLSISGAYKNKNPNLITNALDEFMQIFSSDKFLWKDNKVINIAQILEMFSCIADQEFDLFACMNDIDVKRPEALNETENNIVALYDYYNSKNDEFNDELHVLLNNFFNMLPERIKKNEANKGKSYVKGLWSSGSTILSLWSDTNVKWLQSIAGKEK